MDEIWKQVPGYEGFYEASDLGRVRSLHAQWKEPHILSPGFTPKTGYYFVNLTRRGIKNVSRTVHRIVAMSFLGPANGLEVNHKNGIKSDNRLVNLEYVTRSQNLRHRIDVLGIRLTVDRRGDKSYNKVLCSNQVLEIRARYSHGESLNQLAQSLGVTRSCIAHVVKRRSWSHI